MDDAWVRAVRRRLLSWYDRSRRDLPWRRTPHDAFAQWVAEIMLQQTRVETVVPFYERFLRRFPTVDHLAEAPLHEVLRLWQGLGYYRRAENLHRAARILVRQGTGLPETAGQWRQLPGIGRYTAAAISSVAFGRREAAVDGNVVRVLSRLRASPGDVTRPGARRVIERTAVRLLPRRRCGDFNQAWMDLGATICRPRNPNCPRCPLESHCRARRLDIASKLPIRQRRRKPMIEDRVVAILLRDGRVLMRRRPRGGRWTGLWELPNVDSSQVDPDPALRSTCDQYQVTLSGGFQALGTVEHALTHRLYRFHVYRAECRTGTGVPGRRSASRWVPLGRLGALPIATAHRKLLSRIL